MKRADGSILSHEEVINQLNEYVSPQNQLIPQLHGFPMHLLPKHFLRNS